MGLKTVIEWLPLSERRPADNEACYVVAADFMLAGVCWYDAGSERFFDQPVWDKAKRLAREDISHWASIHGLKALDLTRSKE